MSSEPEHDNYPDVNGADPDAVHDREVLERLQRIEIGPSSDSSWSPLDLGPVLSGDREPVRPEILGEAGRALLYPGKVHAIYAEPEALKTWLALEACRPILTAGGSVMFFDYEDNEGEIVERLRALGVSDDAINKDFIYVRPTERIGSQWKRVAALVVWVKPDLVVIDGVTEAMTVEGLKLESNTDVAVFYERLTRPIAKLGPAVLMVDHVVKSRDDRGRYALGGGTKLSGVDGAAFRVETADPFGRGLTGRFRLYVTKDRPGFVSGQAVGLKRLVAEVVAVSNDDGSEVSITLEQPQGPVSDWKPTRYMERMSRHLEDFPDGLSLRVWLQGVDGGRKYKEQAIDQLVAAGNVRMESKRNAHIHTVITAYREPTDTESTSPETLNLLADELGAVETDDLPDAY
jgi:hypothetical protein